MAIGHRWAGRVYGTHTGNVFVKFEGDDSNLKGTLHFNDAVHGISVHEISGTFDGSILSFSGETKSQREGVEFGSLTAAAHLRPNGDLLGDWQTSIGSAGTFALYPHDEDQTAAPRESTPDQLHTARHTFGPVEIERSEIIALADEIQRSCPRGRVIVTFASGTEQSRFLSDFRNLNISANRVELLKLFVSEQESGSLERSITVEFGQTVNYAMVQSVSEAWALGELEKLKRQIRKFQKVYADRKYGVGINQFMLLGTIVFLPSLELRDRVVLIAAVLGLAFGVSWLHKHYLRHATIYLDSREVNWITRVVPSILSWCIGILAAVIATLVGAYLKGWLVPSAP